VHLAHQIGSNRAENHNVKQTRRVTAPPGDLSNGRQSSTVLILIDVINSFEFEPPGSLQRAWPIAKPLKQLCRRARELKIPVIYVNDNFGRWQSNFDQIVHACLRAGGRAREFVRSLMPDDDDYCVLKPKHSGFFQTPLDLLLKHLRSRRLVLAGLWTNNCVLFTAHDAYMRDFQLCVPRDCVAAHNGTDQRYGLRQMATVLKAETPASRELLSRMPEF
jgi:nicotinamidase-related amidase